uniref:Uncharacterized protein n=1 Tax=Peronospora matthiolae TaxID=2874970 RepID=A0AAV1TF39_9STRA
MAKPRRETVEPKRSSSRCLSEVAGFSVHCYGLFVTYSARSQRTSGQTTDDSRDICNSRT